MPAQGARLGRGRLSPNSGTPALPPFRIAAESRESPRTRRMSP
jgi:hypothetical protein